MKKILRLAAIAHATLLLSGELNASKEKEQDQTYHQKVETHRRAIESRKTLEPLVIVSIAPPYPENLRKKKITGEAVIETVVTYEGVPTKLKLVTATHEEFGKSALLAVGKMRFLPALNEGEPVNSLIRVPVTFDPRKRKH